VRTKIKRVALVGGCHGEEDESIQDDSINPPDSTDDTGPPCMFLTDCTHRHSHQNMRYKGRSLPHGAPDIASPLWQRLVE